MKKLIRFIRMLMRSIKLGFAPSPPQPWAVSLRQSRREASERERLGRQMLPTLNEAARKRFSESVLIKLLGNGWTEGRKTNVRMMASMQQFAPHPFPATVTEILSEFGGLIIYSGIGRSADIGSVNGELTVHLTTLERVLERPLHPIGLTNLFDDDGLVIYMDDSGGVFVDGGTGYKDPGNRRIDYIASSFDRALEIMLGEIRKYDAWPGLPASGVWHYDDVQTPQSDGPGYGKPVSLAEIPDVSPAELHERSQALNRVCAENETYAMRCKKAAKARMAPSTAESLQRVIAFEKEAGICLPDDYVFLITTVGYGVSDDCSLLALEDWDAGYWSQAILARDLIAPCLITPEQRELGDKWLDSLGVEDAEKKWDRDEWDPMRGTLTIAEFGCGLYFRMIVNGPHYGRIFIWGEHALRPPVFQPQLNFSSWITHWLDEAVAGKSVPFLKKQIA